MKVWSYWRCTACDNIIRGDSRSCPSCGQPIPNDVKYLMPDNPEVMAAIAENKILIGNKSTPKSEKHTDEKGVVSDIVPKELESDKPNWLCNYCGYQNYFADTTCKGCGAGKEDATSDYFGNRPEMDENNRKDYQNRTGLAYEAPESIPEPETHELSSNEPKLLKHVLDVLRDNAGNILKGVGIVFGVIFLIWLFTPISRSATVSGFEWERSIEVEQYTLCHESDWSVPNGAHVTSEKSEIHHYNKVLDHYETKTRQVSHRELDGYDTTYKDLGNGQAEVVKTPRYKTVYTKETYQEPVYRKEPVYQTKYYYDIGRWKYSSSLRTEGYDKEPYWHETNLKSYVSNPSYGDKRLGNKSETYNALIFDEDGTSRLVPYNYSDWMNLEIGTEIEYKTFRFSKTPLYGK